MPCSQPRHASTTTRHHQLTLSCLLSCERPSKSWQNLRSSTSIPWGPWSDARKLETYLFDSFIYHGFSSSNARVSMEGRTMGATTITQGRHV